MTLKRAPNWPYTVDRTVNFHRIFLFAQLCVFLCYTVHKSMNHMFDRLLLFKHGSYTFQVVLGSHSVVQNAYH